MKKLYEQDHPEKEPFKFKYEAKQILQNLSKVDEYESNVKGALLYFIGKINYETEDRVAAEQERSISPHGTTVTSDTNQTIF